MLGHAIARAAGKAILTTTTTTAGSDRRRNTDTSFTSGAISSSRSTNSSRSSRVYEPWGPDCFPERPVPGSDFHRCGSDSQHPHFSTNRNVDVNEDVVLRTSRMRAWRRFYEPNRRRQRRFGISDVQNANVATILRIRTSTSTNI